ncbi:MAG TPA: BREX system Lon protease-like protein BrxL, partial [Phycisphaerae bacterium]|nr:BREX system Lon protease-like protein BrxL [Phycisphaerae bacterium]
QARKPSQKYEHLFAVLPPELQDTAFLDRVHAYLPGWEIPKIRPENYATGFGFMTDYLAEIFAEFRRRNFQTHVAAVADFGAMTGRNQDAIKKTCAGMLKLLHPHLAPGEVEIEYLREILDFAIEMRQRVVSQLSTMTPQEFAGTSYEYRLPS